jgi:acylphosphatase
MNALIAKRYLISGRVQGVGFRYFAERAAREIGVTGWARNLADGSVEVHANGSPAQLSELEARLRMGPANADVRGFDWQESSVTSGEGFRIS